MNAYQVRCENCGRNTSQKYAKLHDRQCKSCYEGKPSPYQRRQASASDSYENTHAFRCVEADLDNCPY